MEDVVAGLETRLEGESTGVLGPGCQARPAHLFLAEMHNWTDPGLPHGMMARACTDGEEASVKTVASRTARVFPSFVCPSITTNCPSKARRFLADAGSLRFKES